MAKSKTIQSVKGMHDILPADQAYWQQVQKKASQLLTDYGFDRIDTPLVESTPLFLRSIGDETDIVEKELYAFKTKGGDELALRPEITAGMVRAYIEHGMQVMPQPVKLWSYGPVFRHDQPQAGRYRQFYQLDVESFGDESAVSDAESIQLALLWLESLGFKNLTIRINSIGDANCRPQYLKALRDYLKPQTKKLCVSCRNRMKKNVLRVLDCKVPTCHEVVLNAPQLVGYLDDACKAHFKQLIEFLDEIRAPYLLDPYLVRGLDYYTRTVFEILVEEEKPREAKAAEAVVEAENLKEGEEPEKPLRIEPAEIENLTGLALVGGGRYDGLISLLGGQKTPAVGWAAGIERIVMLLKARDINVPPARPQPKVFLAQIGELAKRKSLVLFEQLRKAGIVTSSSLGKDSIKAQLRMANRVRAKYTLIVGQKEALDHSVILREMDTGVQEFVGVDDIVEAIRKRLKNINS